MPVLTFQTLLCERLKMAPKELTNRSQARREELKALSLNRSKERPMPLTRKLKQLTQQPQWLHKYQQFIKRYAKEDQRTQGRFHPWAFCLQLQFLDDLGVQLITLTTYMSKLVAEGNHRYTITEMAPILDEILRAELKNLGEPLQELRKRTQNLAPASS